MAPSISVKKVKHPLIRKIEERRHSSNVLSYRKLAQRSNSHTFYTHNSERNFKFKSFRSDHRLDRKNLSQI